MGNSHLATPWLLDEKTKEKRENTVQQLVLLLSPLPKYSQREKIEKQLRTLFCGFVPLERWQEKLVKTPEIEGIPVRSVKDKIKQRLQEMRELRSAEEWKSLSRYWDQKLSSGSNEAFSVTRESLGFPFLTGAGDGYTDDLSFIHFPDTIRFGGKRLENWDKNKKRIYYEWPLHLKGKQFSGANLRGTMWEGISFSECSFVECDFEGAEFVDCAFGECVGIGVFGRGDNTWYETRMRIYKLFLVPFSRFSLFNMPCGKGRGEGGAENENENRVKGSILYSLCPCDMQFIEFSPFRGSSRIFL